MSRRGRGRREEGGPPPPPPPSPPTSGSGSGKWAHQRRAPTAAKRTAEPRQVSRVAWRGPWAQQTKRQLRQQGQLQQEHTQQRPQQKAQQQQQGRQQRPQKEKAQQQRRQQQPQEEKAQQQRHQQHPKEKKVQQQHHQRRTKKQRHQQHTQRPSGVPALRGARCAGTARSVRAASDRRQVKSTPHLGILGHCRSCQRTAEQKEQHEDEEEKEQHEDEAVVLIPWRMRRSRRKARECEEVGSWQRSRVRTNGALVACFRYLQDDIIASLSHILLCSFAGCLILFHLPVLPIVCYYLCLALLAQERPVDVRRRGRRRRMRSRALLAQEGPE